MSNSLSFASISATLTNLDFLAIQRFITPSGTIWHAFAAGDAESWWHDEPIIWEVFVAELGVDALLPTQSPAFYISGTLFSPGTFVFTEQEWGETLMQLLPETESWTEMDEVD